jgi:hypothetical protein
MLSIRLNTTTDIPSTIPAFDISEVTQGAVRARELAKQFGIRARVRDLGLWQVARDKGAVVEAYQATPSFRYGLLGIDGEARDGSGGMPASDPTEIAREWMSAVWPKGGEPTIGSVTEREVLIAERGVDEPRQLVVGADVNIRFGYDGLRLLGPGAKAQVSVNRDGQVVAAYCFWRDVSSTSEVQTRSFDEVFERFSSSSLFADLSDDTARAEVTEASFGYLCLPPTEPMQALIPVVELRGTIATEYQERYDFIRYMYATQPPHDLRDRKRLNIEPSLVLG